MVFPELFKMLSTEIIKTILSFYDNEIRHYSMHLTGMQYQQKITKQRQ
jgi:hypothetical protein